MSRIYTRRPTRVPDILLRSKEMPMAAADCTCTCGYHGSFFTVFFVHLATEECVPFRMVFTNV